MPPCKRRKLDPESEKVVAEKLKAQVRARVKLPFSESEAGLRVRQDALSGTAEEHPTAGAVAGTGQSADERKPTGGQPVAQLLGQCVSDRLEVP